MISIGMDVGREHDPAALAVLHAPGELRAGSHRPRWDVLEIGNLPLGTSYQRLAEIVTEMAAPLAQAGYPVVVTIDATGIGAAVVEQARGLAPELHLIAVTIGPGQCLTHVEADRYTVGKHRLTSVLQVAFEQNGLTIPGSPGGRLFDQQLRRFVTKPAPGGPARPSGELRRDDTAAARSTAGYERHEADTGHDDLVLAAELALWTGDTMFDQQAGVAP